jgi:hypothetical protein
MPANTTDSLKDKPGEKMDSGEDKVAKKSNSEPAKPAATVNPAQPVESGSVKQDL